MAETIVQQPKPTASQAPAPVSTPAVNATVVPAVEAKDSVIKRAAAIPTPAPSTNGNEPPKVSISMDDVKDPLARQILEKKLEEANKGVSEAFGKVGAEKSKYLQEIEKLKAETNRPWTPERLQQEINKQDFIQSATSLQSSLAPQGVPQETWSALSPEDKQLILQAKQEAALARQEVFQMQQSQVLTTVDTELKQEYPDYDSAPINAFYQKAQSNQLTPKEMREAVYWAINGRKLCERSYELGRQDNKTTIQEKINGISPNGLNITPTMGNTVERKPGERSGNVFAAHGHKVLEMLRSMPRKT